jgi:hypothetical protein
VYCPFIALRAIAYAPSYQQLIATVEGIGTSAFIFDARVIIITVCPLSITDLVIS